MDVREKMVELLVRCSIEEYITIEPIAESRLVDFLVKHGVMVQEWISVDDRLPENGDTVLCLMKFGGQRLLLWDGVSSRWLGYGSGDDWQKADVTHWQYLPQPPKGE